jgi:hypothetical protein
MQMGVTLKSNKVYVRDVERLRERLADYESEGVEFNLREEGARWTLELEHAEDDLEVWDSPRAVKVEDLLDVEADPDDDDYSEAEAEVWAEKGEEGFLSLLGELAQHVESALLILVGEGTELEGYRYSAQAWLVQPGAKEVATLRVSS